MLRKPVDSSNIHSIGYDEDSKILEIEFHNGRIYNYYNVPKKIHTAIMAAGSKGSYLNQNIKDKYQYKEI